MWLRYIRHYNCPDTVILPLCCASRAQWILPLAFRLKGIATGGDFELTVLFRVIPPLLASGLCPSLYPACDQQVRSFKKFEGLIKKPLVTQNSVSLAYSTYQGLNLEAPLISPHILDARRTEFSFEILFASSSCWTGKFQSVQEWKWDYNACLIDYISPLIYGVVRWCRRLNGLSGTPALVTNQVTYSIKHLHYTSLR